MSVWLIQTEENKVIMIWVWPRGKKLYDSSRLWYRALQKMHMEKNWKRRSIDLFTAYKEVDKLPCWCYRLNINQIVGMVELWRVWTEVVIPAATLVTVKKTGEI